MTEKADFSSPEGSEEDFTDVYPRMKKVTGFQIAGIGYLRRIKTLQGDSQESIGWGHPMHQDCPFMSMCRHVVSA